MDIRYQNKNLPEKELHVIRELESLTESKPTIIIDEEECHVNAIHILDLNTQLPDTIKNLSKLKIFSILAGKVKELPESLGDLTNLKTLIISKTKIQKLPESIGNLSNLEVIDAFNNQINNLPKSIGNLSNLEILRLTSNQIKELPSTMGSLSNLKHLSVARNHLRELPEWIGQLTNLESIYIDHNPISKLPRSIGFLKNLKEIRTGMNYLKAIPDSIQNHTLIKSIESSLNLPLVFHYFPNKYSKYVKLEEDQLKMEKKNQFYQNKIISEMNKPYMKSYYWKYIVEHIKIEPNRLDDTEWSFSLNKINSNGEPEPIKLRTGETVCSLNHPFRKDNFIQLQIVIEFSGFVSIIYLYPLIENITLFVETDRGDLIQVQFTDFYFEMNIGGGIQYQSKAYLKFDPNYSLAPYARIKFIDIEVKFRSSLLPISYLKTPELVNLHTNISRIEEKIDNLIRHIEISTKGNQNILPLKPKENIMLNEEEISENLANNFINAWREPKLPTIILKIGRRFGSFLGKYAEYLAAGVIVAGVIPSLLQFLYRLIVVLVQWGWLGLSQELSKISVPLLFEIFTYIPLFILFIYLTVKFIFRQRIPKE